MKFRKPFRASVKGTQSSFFVSSDSIESASSSIELGLIARNEKSISPTRVLTCLEDPSSVCDSKTFGDVRHSLRNLQDVLIDTTRTNSRGSKSRVLRLRDVSHTQDILVDLVEPLDEFLMLRHL